MSVAAAADIRSRTALLSRSRSAQALWAGVGIRHRLKIIRELRHLLAANSLRFAALVSPHLVRSTADTLSSEVLPLADAARFLEENAEAILRSHIVSSKGRPMFFRKVTIRHRYDPFGVVLIIGPANYPLFLPGSQSLQALVAGNAVLLKPGKGGGGVARLLSELATQANLPRDLLMVLDESVESASAMVCDGVDKVVLTGSSTSGRAVLKLAAETLTPSVVELSGCDPFFVLEGADLDRAADAAAFAIRLNGGETCIAPRRFFVNRAEEIRFSEALARRISPFPTLAWRTVDSEDEALELAKESSHALGATVFGPEPQASRFASRVFAGVVVVNDATVPTADPRITFGGRRASGFGKTRGAEGLREMTVLKVIVTQRGRRLRHLEPAHPRAEQLFPAYITVMHEKGFRNRLGGLRRVIEIGLGK